MDDDPTYDIAVACVGADAPRCEARLKQVIDATLRRHEAPAAQISVALVDDDRIAQLNEHHLNHQYPTDVLAFDLRNNAPARSSLNGKEVDGFTIGDGKPIDGEIVVSFETAAREAGERGHGIDAELALYVVHGTLHLLGYDDRHERDAARMHEVEDEILISLGWGPVYRANLG